jgi:hypothetical protein
LDTSNLAEARVLIMAVSLPGSSVLNAPIEHVQLANARFYLPVSLAGSSILLAPDSMTADVGVLLGQYPWWSLGMPIRCDQLAEARFCLPVSLAESSILSTRIRQLPILKVLSVPHSTATDSSGFCRHCIRQLPMVLSSVGAAFDSC